MLNFNKKRKFRRDFRDDEFIQWDLDEVERDPDERVFGHPEGSKYLFPPSAMEHMYASSVCTKYVHTSINKVRYPVNAVTFSPDGRRVITGASSGEFTLWNSQHFNFETILQAHDQAVRSLVFSHSDEFLLSGDHGGTIKYWEPNFNCVKVVLAHDQPLRQVCFSPTDLKFASCADDGHVKIWDFVRADIEVKYESHGWDVKTVDWHSTKSLLASGGKDTKVKLWDPRAKKELSTIHAHKQTVMKLKWNQNGHWLLTSSRDQMSKLFDIRTMKELGVYRGHKREVTSCQWHPFHEGMFITGSGDGCVNFYQVGSEDAIGKIDLAHDSSIWDVAWHPFGHEVVTISNDQLLRFWTRNRPGDKLDDKYNQTSRAEANVDPSKLGRMPEAVVEQLMSSRNSTSVPNTAAGDLGTNLMETAVIPGMSSTQAKMRKLRIQAIPATSTNRSGELTQLSVLTYDMLAHTSANTKYFPSVSESLLQWSFRSQNMLLELKQRAADVLCLQEVSFYKEFWQPNLKGYQVAYQAYPDAGAGKGVAIATRPQKLVLREAVQVRFTDEDQAYKSVAIIGIYETAASAAQSNPKATRVLFVIASVALSNYGNEQKQQEQTRILLHTIEKACASCRQDPSREVIVNTIVAGNFNFVPESLNYRLISENSSENASSTPSHKLPLNSAFARYESGREPPFTTIGEQWEGTTDFIFYSHKDLGLSSLLEFPARNLVGKSLPSADYSSNHFSLVANFTFRQ